MGNHPVPLRLFEVDRSIGRRGNDSSDVSEDVDLAVFVVDPPYLGLPLGEIGDVHRCTLGRATRRRDCRDGLVAILQVEANDVCPF